MKIDLAHFSWNALAYDDPSQAAFQIAIRKTAETTEESIELRGPEKIIPALNMLQAAEIGATLETIAAGFNDAMAARANVLEYQLMQAQAKIETLTEQVADLETQVAEMASRLAGS